MDVGKPNILVKFLDSKDPQLLLIADFSTWSFIKSKPAVIEITLPGSSEPIIYSFVKGSINSYNSQTLYTNCSECEYSDLPDGIFSATIKGSPDTFNYETHYLKTDVLELELSKRTIDIGFQYTSEAKSKMEELDKARFYLESAKANVQLGFISDGNRAFEEAQKIIRKCSSC